MEHSKGSLKRHDFWLDLDDGRKPPTSIGAVCKVEISDEEALANADHLVKCWNSYDKMRAAIERYIYQVESNTLLHDQMRNSTTYNMFKDALK